MRKYRRQVLAIWRKESVGVGNATLGLGHAGFEGVAAYSSGHDISRGGNIRQEPKASEDKSVDVIRVREVDRVWREGKKGKNEC